MSIVLITGVPSVGKSTVLAELAKLRDAMVINTGTLLFDLAKERGLVRERDELRALAPPILAGLRIEVAASVPRDGLTLVDSHLTVKGRAGLVCVLSSGVLERMPLRAIVIIESDPQAIIERRARDPTRKRDADGVEETRRHQEHNRAAAWAIAATRETAVVCIQNEDPIRAAQEVEHILKQIEIETADQKAPS